MRNTGERRPGKPTSEVVPGPQGGLARTLFKKLAQAIEPHELSFGGGAVLSARWGHRESFDIDLFCRPEAYARLGREGRERVEELIKQIPGCNPEVTWCDDIATYTEIRGFEATVLPRPCAIEPATHTVLWQTELRTQSTEEILYAKIAYRMYEGGEITVRDAYDIACAAKMDPKALKRALEQIDQRALSLVQATVEQLPAGWSREDENALVNPRYKWDEPTRRRKLLEALGSAGAERNRGPEGRGQ